MIQHAAQADLGLPPLIIILTALVFYKKAPKTHFLILIAADLKKSIFLIIIINTGGIKNVH